VTARTLSYPAISLFSSRFTGTKGPEGNITHSKVVCSSSVSKFTPTQSHQSKVVAKLTVDGGVKMDKKNWVISFKKFVVGFTVASVVNMSVVQ
jgi:hypothetical protein